MTVRTLSLRTLSLRTLSLRTLLPFAALALFATACGEPLDAFSQGPARVPVVEMPTCGQNGVPVITGVSAGWDDEVPGFVAVELRGLTCNARMDGFRFSIFDGAERDITGRSWPEVDAVDVDDGRFVVRGVAAGCADYRDAARIELWATGEFGTRCAGPVQSTEISVALD